MISIDSRCPSTPQGFDEHLGDPESSTTIAAMRFRSSIGLLAILVASLVPRFSVLVNAEHGFNSDEAVNALVIRRLLQGELSLYNWDATYYGIVEGLLAIPFVAVLGFTPLAFKLSALMGFWLLVVATYFLASRLFGPREGLAAAALLALFSPQLVLWSTLASGGYTLMVAWGTLTLFYFAGLQRVADVRPHQLFAIGSMIGFGLYIYELYLVYVPVFAAYALSVSFPWRALRSPSPAARSAAWRRAPRQLAQLAWVLTGVIVGWSPKLVALASDRIGSKKPFYDFATPEQVRANLELLLERSMPAFFGVNLTGSSEVAGWVGPPFPFSAACGWLLVALYLCFYVWAVRRSAPRLRAVLGRPPAALDAHGLVLLLVPVVAAAFVLSPNPQDVLASRYLLPWLSSLPIFAGAGLVRLASDGGRRRLAAVGSAVLLFLSPAIAIVREQQARQYLGPRLEIRRVADPLAEVVRFLRARGVTGAFGGYWTAYKATFIAGEELIVAPNDWDRYPPYTARVRQLDDVAFIFAQPRSAAEAAFLAEVQGWGRTPEIHDFGPYRVYLSSGSEPLIPLGSPDTARPLSAPRASVAATRVPAEVPAGARFSVPVTVANEGSEVWSARGLGGTYRVGLSYHWLDDRGHRVVFGGLRSPLPRDTPPGTRFETIARIEAPATPGNYRLVLTLVQEAVLWFDDAGAGAAYFTVRVTEPAHDGSVSGDRPGTSEDG
jgi:hypothetical protein